MTHAWGIRDAVEEDLYWLRDDPHNGPAPIKISQEVVFEARFKTD